MRGAHGAAAQRARSPPEGARGQLGAGILALGPHAVSSNDSLSNPWNLTYAQIIVQVSIFPYLNIGKSIGIQLGV